MKITREALKTIVKETMIEESEYQEFFKKALEKAGKSIPDMSDEEKKAFFNNIEKTWKGKGPKKEISETELEEAQSPAQKAAFEKMLAKKDGKDESTDDEKESVNEDQWKNTRIQSKNIFRMLKQKYNNNIPKMEKGLETVLKQNKTKNDQGEIVRQEFKKYFKIKESIIKEGFAVWEMSFADMNLNGVELSSKKKYKVKARNTVEAIKKAASMAGLKGQDWVATQTNYLKKIG